MADRTVFPVRMITPEGVGFEGQAQLVIVSGVGGQIGIMARHAPIVADLKMGTVRVQLEDGSWRVWATSEGFATAHQSTATVVVEEALEVGDDFDASAADEWIREAQEKLEQLEGGADADDVYRSDIEACNKTIAWGRHVKALADSGATAGSAAH